MRHASEADIAACVQGLAPEDPEWFRRHVSECEPCARRLEQEARLELALLDAAGEAPAGARRDAMRPARQSWSRVAWIAAAFAILTGAWLVATLVVRGPGPQGGDATPGAWARDFETPGEQDLEAVPAGYDVVSPDQYCRDSDPERIPSSCVCDAGDSPAASTLEPI